jgi:hypothetical protein
MCRRTFSMLRVALLVTGIAAGGVIPASAQQPAGRQGGPAQQPAVRGGYTEAATLQVRIMEFKADRDSIKPGESITLSWIVENPRAAAGADPVTVTPGIGRVAPRSSIRLTPKATTTYTLTATGLTSPPAPGKPQTTGAVTRSVTVSVAGTQPLGVSEAAASTGEGPTPRTADGKPDLTGVYGFGTAPGGRGAQPPPAPGAVARTPTLKPGAEKYRVVRGPEDAGLYASCRPPGVPQTFMAPYFMQIVQSPKYIVLVHEYLTLPRIIEMDAQHPADPDPFYMGHSVGKWEGDTLVVDSVGFKESEFQGFKTTESFHIVERFRRPTLGTLQYEAVLEDPNVWTEPWMITRTFPFLPEHNRIDEFYCENNRDYKELFGKK